MPQVRPVKANAVCAPEARDPVTANVAPEVSKASKPAVPTV